MIKKDEQLKAREMRKHGFSLNEISNILKVSKSSVSVWVRNIELTQSQKEQLISRPNNWNHDSHLRISVTKKKSKRIEDAKIEADKEWEMLKNDPDFMFGLALYIGEGAKYEDTMLSIVNYDPFVVRACVKFYIKIGIDESKIKYHLTFHDGRSEERIKKFWKSFLNIKDDQITSTIIKKFISNKNPKRTRPNGGCIVIYYDAHIKRKLIRWMELSLM